MVAFDSVSRLARSGVADYAVDVDAGPCNNGKAMYSDMLWINEGFVLDDAGNLISTSYVDQRPPESRTTIHTLVKGSRREHALEDAETILVSPVKRFREEGERLIRDEQEGLAEEKTETVKPETPEEAFERRRVADLNEATELLESGVQVTRRVTSRSVKRSSKHVAFGREWWIFSTAIMPETEEEWAAWRATLDPAYDHESRIGQPAKFAQALGRMVTEQLGPQCQDGWLRGSINGREDARSKHPAQWILHGPVVYTDRLYDTLARDVDDTMRVAASIFTKSTTHSAQREYRFAILRDGTVDKKEFLAISGMMRDALQPTPQGLVRLAPEPLEATESDEAASRSRAGGSRKLHYQRSTAKERVMEWEETRSETRGADGEILSSESARRENVHEKTVTREFGEERRSADTVESVGPRNENGSSLQRDPEPLLIAATCESDTTDEEAVKEIAIGDNASSDGGSGKDDGIAVVQGYGRAYTSLQERFKAELNDPAVPMGGTSEPWAEEALSREEVPQGLQDGRDVGPQGDRRRHREPRGGVERLLARHTMHPQHLRAAGRRRGHRGDQAGTLRRPPHQSV